MLMKVTITIAILSLCSLGTCMQKNGKVTSDVSEKKIQVEERVPSTYQYDSPDQVISLGSALIEISGLAYQADGDYLIANNDESGHFFKLHRSDGKLAEKVKFGKKGDYESLEVVDDNIIVALNTGTLHIYDLETKKTEKYNNQLKSENNIEGLAFDARDNKLFLACKGRSLDPKTVSYTHLTLPTIYSV